MKSYVEKIKEIQDELKWDPELFESKIQIEIDNDIVTLNGSVESKEKKDTAESVARRTEGIRAVINNLVITPSKHHEDAPMEVPSANSGDPDNTLKISGA